MGSEQTTDRHAGQRVGIRRIAAVLVCCLLVASITGCADTEQEAADSPQPMSGAPSGPPDGIGSVDWPDEEAAIGAAFRGLPESLGGLTLEGLREADDAQYAYAADYWEDPETQTDLTMFIRAERRVEPIGSRPGDVARRLFVFGGPAGCTDVQASSVFAPLLAVQPFFDLDQSPALQDEPWNALMAEMDSLDQGLDPGGLIWFTCTGAWSAFTESRLAADEWIYYATWSDDNDWIYDIWAPSPELRSAAIEALAAGAGGLE